MENERFWRRSYDRGLTDLNPREWETTMVEAAKDVFIRFPDKTALAYMGTHISYAQLDRYANRFAHMLHAYGFSKGDVVGINLPNIPDFVIAGLGTLRAGCIVSGVSPQLPADEMAFQLKDSGAKGLVTLDNVLAERLGAIVENLPELKMVATSGIGDFLPMHKRVLCKLLKKFPACKVNDFKGKTVLRMEEIVKGKRFPSTELTADLTPDDIAYLPYTGGTTGASKGAMISHRNVLANVIIMYHWMGWEGEQGKGIVLSGVPFIYAAGRFAYDCGVYMGWTQVLIPNPRDADHICAQLRRYRPRIINNVPYWYQMLMDNPTFKSLDFSKLEICLSSASPFTSEDQQRLEGVVGRDKLLEVYGMTEATCIVAANPLRGVKKPGSLGLPLLNTDIRLRDPVTGLEVAPGEPGEICVKGPQIMVGYFNKPEDTTRVIDKDGYLHTGDVAVQDADGYLRLMDNTKDMIILGGFKVLCTKVEEVLSRHEAVDNAALIGVDNPERPGSELVKAYITLKPGYRIKDVDALKERILAFARDTLSPHEVPKMLEIRTDLPLTSVGKVDKKALREQARAQIWAGQERRSQMRGLVDLPCDLDGVSHGRQTHEKAHVIDLSNLGMFVEAEEPLDEGTDAQITAIQFGNTYWFKGKVLRRASKGIAIRLTESIPQEIDGILNSGRK